MRNYELMYILKPDMEEEAVVAAVGRFEEIVKNGGGDNIKSDRMGKRRMAYEINDIGEGHYVLMTFQSPSAAAQELSRVMRLQDDIIRHIVIRKDE